MVIYYVYIDTPKNIILDQGSNLVSMLCIESFAADFASLYMWKCNKLHWGNNL